MSQAELEREDQEVMEIVNRHAHPEAAAAAKRIAAEAAEPVEDVWDPDAQYRELCQEGEKKLRNEKRKELLRVAIFVAACLGVAAALVAAWYVPKLLIWVVNIGVLACGSAIAVKIDTYIRWWI